MNYYLHRDALPQGTANMAWRWPVNPPWPTRRIHLQTGDRVIAWKTDHTKCRYVWATVCWVCRLRDQHQAYMKIRLVKFTYIDQQINQLDIDKYKDEYVQTYVHDIHKYIKHTSVNTGTYVDAYLPTYLHACIQQNKEIDQYVVYIEYT